MWLVRTILRRSVVTYREGNGSPRAPWAEDDILSPVPVSASLVPSLTWKLNIVRNRQALECYGLWSYRHTPISLLMERAWARKAYQVTIESQTVFIFSWEKRTRIKWQELVIPEKACSCLCWPLSSSDGTLNPGVSFTRKKKKNRSRHVTDTRR